MEVTDLVAQAPRELLGPAKPMENGRFPLLLKLLDANDILSLQVHPDARCVEEIGPSAALKTECWYYLESREGYVYLGVQEGTSPEQFRQAIQNDTVEKYVERKDVHTGDFHYVPAGTVHALGPGLVVAEVQTPSDTTYRVTDWGRGREIHVERSMQCIHFNPLDEQVPGRQGQTLLETEFFTVAKRETREGRALPERRCSALMFLSAPQGARVVHQGKDEPQVSVSAGDTVLVPAALTSARVECDGPCTWLEITLPERG
jgi:mannose-6-phosphate isomerase